MPKKLEKPKKWKLSVGKDVAWSGKPEHKLTINGPGGPFLDLDRSEARKLYKGLSAIYED